MNSREIREIRVTIYSRDIEANSVRPLYKSTSLKMKYHTIPLDLLDIGYMYNIVNNETLKFQEKCL